MNPTKPYAGVPGCRSAHLDIPSAEALLAAGYPDSKQDEAAALQPTVSVWAKVLVCRQQHHRSCPSTAAGLETWPSLVPILRCHHHAHHFFRTGEAAMPMHPCLIINGQVSFPARVMLVFVMPNVFSGQPSFQAYCLFMRNVFPQRVACLQHIYMSLNRKAELGINMPIIVSGPVRLSLPHALCCRQHGPYPSNQDEAPCHVCLLTPAFCLLCNWLTQ